MSLILIPIIPLYAVGNGNVVRVVVGIKSDHDYIKSRDMLKGFGVVDLEIPEVKAVVLTIPAQVIERIKGLPFVKYVEEDKPVKALGEVQWNIEMINATVVWGYNEVYGDAAYGYDQSIQVAVVDTGIDYTHKDLQGAITWCVVSLRNGKTFYEGGNLKNCADGNGHGTHVTGIIAARLNNLGVVGVAPKVLLYAVKVLGPSGSGYVSDVAKGIIEAVKGPDDINGTEDDADVISMSLGGPDSQLLSDSVMYAYSNGVVLVAAAGNEGAQSPTYPAAYGVVIAVGAVDQSYQVPSWSNRNPDVVAPGVNILSTWPKNKYAYASGTSMACPHVSGTIALIQAIRLASGMSKLSPGDVIELIRSTAIDLGDSGTDPLYGYGLVDASKAVETALAQSN